MEFVVKILPLWFCLSINQVYSDKTIYPSVHWSPGNTLFTKGSGDKEVEIFVVPDSQITVVCPNVVLVQERATSKTLEQHLFENLLQVSEETFEGCELPASNSSLLIKCDNPSELISRTLNFSSNSKGKSFYFISTSDGEKEATTKSESHCFTHNLKMKITVCDHQTDSRCEACKLNPDKDCQSTSKGELGQRTSPESSTCEGFWMGFSSGMCMLLLYSMIVNILFLKHLSASKRKVGPAAA